jgi:hypothetical protein
MNKTRKLVGNVTYHVPVDNSYIAITNLYKKQGGEYRMMPYTLPKKGYCDFVNSEKLFVEDLIKASNFPYPFPCPFPKVGQIVNFLLLKCFQHLFRELLWFTGMKSSSRTSIQP